MKTLLVILLALVFTIGHGQTRFQTLDEYLTYVTVHNPSLESESLSQQMTESRVRTAWSSLLPQVRAFGTFDNNINLPVQLIPAQIFGGPEGTFREIKFGTRYNASYGAEASLSLLNVSNWKNVEAANIGAKAARAQYEDRKLTTLEAAASAYYFSLLSTEATRISAELLSAADSLLTAAEVRLKNGMIEQLEYNRVKALYIDSHQQHLAYQVAQKKNHNQLKILAGLNLTDSLQLTQSLLQLAASSVNSKLGVTTSALPAYKMFSYRTMQAQQELKRQQARVLPEISAFARYTRQSFSNEPNVFSNDNTWYDITVAGLRAEWLIFTGLNRQSQMRQASLKAKQSEADLKNYLLKSDKELEELSINHELALEQTNDYREQYELNLTNYKIANVKYNAGVYTIDQYVTIYQELVRSQNQYLNALASLLMYESVIQSRNKIQ